MLETDEALARLVGEIRAGRCVAFIGAGFSAPVCRSWPALLAAVADEQPAVAAQVHSLLDRGDGTSYEIAAQILEDVFAEEKTAKLLDVVRAHTPKREISESARAQMRRRTELLQGIPFSAILTTNFDDVLRGKVLDRASYGALLRDADRRWLETRFWKKNTPPPIVLKLHGDLRGDKGITLSRRGYRTRLYAEPGYLNVLRTVFMTKTLLFIGFSFNDAYLNELRSEALAYVGEDGATPTLAYAVVPDLHPAVHAHYGKHEGVHVFGYESKDGHGHVDTFLEALHAQTNPAKVMGPRLRGRRILWVDPSEQNNQKGHRFLQEASDDLCTIDVARSPAEGLARLETEHYDLVITRWGHHPSRAADGVELLEGMRRADRRVPAVVFASGHFAEANREAALRLGALEYTSDWETLFEVIDRRFGPPP